MKTGESGVTMKTGDLVQWVYHPEDGPLIYLGYYIAYGGEMAMVVSCSGCIMRLWRSELRRFLL